jgi:hypothetical protein
VRHPHFAIGLDDIRAGRPFADHIEDPTWSYERGRQFGVIAPRSMPLFIDGGRRLLDLATARYWIKFVHAARLADTVIQRPSAVP